MKLNGMYIHIIEKKELLMLLKKNHNHIRIFHHGDWTINVTETPPPGGHTINVASRMLKRKNAPPPQAHVFEPTRTIFELAQDSIGTNLLTKFHDDRQYT
ncbi:hypothetical protein DPMN_144053 [Dreissena polymorpha]|uniref:Uncharacterized protein n=1 Tax=Dreissena polymorpha TaxID=45954 RepID=A0A9D4JK90_DREPO|nr:hypothetical protein DPMN_144053 [Dreissena polymorpha]